MLPYKKIFCPIDFSEPSYDALPRAVELASHFGAELILVHVMPKQDGIPPDPLYVFKGPEGYEQELEIEDEKMLAEVIEQRVPKGVLVRSLVLHGDAADEIMRAAETAGADLIVIATHGRTGLRHLVLGSVTEKIVRHTLCPVLIIRATQ